jgi:ferredoxin
MPKIKVRINKEKCIGCGTCYATAPEIFEMDVDGKAKITSAFQEVEITDPMMIDKAKAAASMCPDQAIEVEELPD